MHSAQRHDAILRALRKQGSVRVTELAAQLDVSVITIRRDIVRLAERGSLVRVHGGATLLRPEPVKKAPEPPVPKPRQQQRVIGMLIPAASYYFHELLQGAQAAAASHQLRLVVGVSRHDHDEDRVQVDRLLESGAEGLLLTPSAGGPLPAWAEQINVPAVFVERRQPVDLDPIEYVASDHQHGAVQALRHLARLGHRRVAVYTLDTPTGPWIHHGFEEAADALGLDRDVPRVNTTGTSDLDETIERALASGATAFLVHPDETAVMVLQRLQQRGLTVPDDVSLLSYDDEIAALADVPITAVAPPRRAIGHAAVELLMRRLRSGEGPVMRHVHLLPTLRIRASTGSVKMAPTTDSS